ncbi:MAG: hypothetical protein BWZ02_02047 [Lentisphaerae bacterium ADurb.BinA184]|nr:MAG: hypothetical protein BWZ02_02047 [Lentisphaerae bacterium ADurb.BinA184]
MSKYTRFEDLPVWQAAATLYEKTQTLLETPGLRLTYGFRNQLDRAALSVSNNIAEGFERASTRELLSFLSIARGSAGEVRSMMALAARRPALAMVAGRLADIRAGAEACSRQIAAWAASVENSPVQGSRHLTAAGRQDRRAAEAARWFRNHFLTNMSPDHPLYNTREARLARGENPDGPVAEGEQGEGENGK